MLTEKTFYLRFVHRDTSEIEEQEYTRATDAWESFRLFAEPDSSEMYTGICLTEFDWATREEHQLAVLAFLPA